MVHVSIYANDVVCADPFRSTFDLDLHMCVYHGMRNREEKLGLVVEESVNGGIVLWKVQLIPEAINFGSNSTTQK